MNFDADIGSGSLTELVDAIYRRHRVTAFEAYSEFGKELPRFESSGALNRHVDTKLSARLPDLHMALYLEGSGPTPAPQRIDLKPEYCDGHTFRYTVRGWGLVYLKFDPRRGGQGICSLSVNSKSRARGWYSTTPELGDPELWDWPLIEKYVRGVRRIMKRLEKRQSG